MIVNQAKILEPKNFYQASIWKLDDIDEIYYPIELMNEDELPDYPYRLFFKAKFITQVSFCLMALRWVMIKYFV